MPEKAARRQEAPETVETLVKELMARATRGAAAPERPAAGGRVSGGHASFTTDELDDVLFEREIDGVRCVVSRARKPSAETLPLSPREREVAPHDREGLSEQDHRLRAGDQCVDGLPHLRRIFAKLGVTSRTAMVTRMFKDGRLE